MKTTSLTHGLARKRRTAKAAAVGRKKGLRLVTGAAKAAEPSAKWPARPNSGVLSERTPLFFICRDDDGFWLARHADLPIGGLFLSQRSAMNFAKRSSGTMPCATMILSEPHKLDTENRGNRVADRSIAKARALGARMSRAHIEDRMLRAAMEAELYRGRYKHSNKNDDDLPMAR